MVRGGTHYNQEFRFSSSAKCKKGPQVLTSLLNQRRKAYFLVTFSNSKLIDYPEIVANYNNNC